jgi:hypothetical protein
MNKLQLKIHRFLHWEYWPFAAVYYPILPIWFYYAVRARSFFFFNAANPSIKNGGMAMESKKDIYDLIPQQFYPKTILVNSADIVENTLQRMLQAGIEFPCIAKPDIGMKALAVKQIHNIEQLVDYQNKFDRDFLIQEFIDFPNELGIFYVRMPDQQNGKITGIVSKEYLTITGNGKDTMTQLIKNNPRSFSQLAQLEKMYGKELNTILPVDKKFILVPYGSHTRSAKQNEKLQQTFNQICTQVSGFYFGRLDIRYQSFEDLCEGKNFSIIEINGAGAEPTHIYDPSHSVFFAWKEIIKHWSLLYRVSMANKKKGAPFLTYAEGMEMLRDNKQLEAFLKTI